MGAFDLEAEKIVWEKTYEAGCDRSSITMDGKKLYVPTGWWYAGEDSGFLIVSADNGQPVSGSKYIEVHFRDGKVVQMGNEFGLGRK